MSEITKDTDNEENISSKEYENLLDQYQFNAKEIVPGKIIKGKVLKVTSSHVLVDVGFKSEGIIPREDFTDDQKISEIRSGDTVEAVVERSDSKEGYLILSHKKAFAMKGLNDLERAYHNNTWVTGKITEKIKNGYTVNVGIKTFLPDSHADTRAVKEPKDLIGNTYKFKVIKFDRRSENAVLSRKLLLQVEREKRRRRVFEQLSQGQKIKGKVRTLTNFGAFIDLGGVEGLLHISDISWGKTSHPSEVFQPDQEVEVVVLDFNENDDKISLGYKQLSPDPWENVEEKYKVGQKVKGKVVSLADFGAFVELEKGVEGLVHISDLTWSRKTVHPKKILTPGEEVAVTILDINPSSKRISLGLKQAAPHPLEMLKQKFSPGSRIKGTITSITDFGAFMEVEKEIDGLIHISDISWKKIKHPSKNLKVGEEVEAIILNIDVEKQKLSLGIKQLEGDIWEDFFKRQKIGDIVKTKIVRLTDFGVFVEITPGIEGVVFLSELDEKKIEKPEEIFSVGEKRNAKIIKMNPQEKKISLSFRLAQLELQKLEYQKYVQSQDGKITLGDLLKDQLNKIQLSQKPNKKEKKDD
ncbi:MAG: 30S ribosomal protein S1 [Candidatus Aminicenantes bacterium]|nr:30S ribosomal protein S1 [Candidatus Aminicenantes bacterium]MCK4758748.1 30S ribosomal protein S1 [Candidatus Aminicenantes bacterium]